MTALSYEQFVRAKVRFDEQHGFHVDPGQLHPALKPHQRQIVTWALTGGRRGVFASFGLGKTVIQLEIARQIQAREGGRQLIVCPLGVRGEFRHDAEHIFSIQPPAFIRRGTDITGDGIYLTNYETVRDGRLDVTAFDTVCLDEAAVLRNFGSKTSQTFTDAFGHCRYRFVATATPSPNEYRELFEYAHFLGVMDRGQCMTRFTKRDSTKANRLSLLPNMESEFWLWVASWAVFLTTPAEICGCGCGHKETA